MQPSRFSLRREISSHVFAVLLAIGAITLLPGTLSQGAGKTQETGATRQLAQEQQSQEQQPASKFDKSIFHDPIPAEQLAFLNSFAGSPAKQLVRNKQYRKLTRGAMPNWMFHYGWDMPVLDALEKVLNASSLPVQIRNGRYVTVLGRNGPYLQGRGFMWIDMQDGIVLGGFFFHPTNGEPTPSMTIFSKQVKEESLKMSQLPPAFAQDLSHWSAESGISLVTTRYFIGGLERKMLLEHDEDYCAPSDGTAPAGDCEEINADAADLDLNAAYYLEQTNHATNATAWMIVGPDQIAWIQVRDDACRIGSDRLRCRIRMTRERTHVIIHRHRIPAPQPPHR